MVSERMKMTAKTPEGEAFIDAITEKFNEAVTADNCNVLLGRGIAAANRMLDELNGSNDVAAAIDKAKTKLQDVDKYFINVMDFEPDRSFDYMILNEFMYHSTPLSYENGGCLNQVVNSIPISIDYEKDADTIHDFLSRHDNTQLTDWLTPEMNHH